MFFDKQKIIFVHIPKTGGSSLEYAICKNIYKIDNQNNVNILSYKNFTINGMFKNNVWGKPNGHPHSYISEYSKYLKLEEFLKFTILRNPYEQIRSLYNQIRKNIKTSSFEHFIMSNDSNSIKSYSHFIDQYKYTHINGVLSVDKIFVYDRYNEAQEFVENKFNIKIDRDKKLWKTNYTDEKFTKEMKEKFESIHYKSIELYNKFV